MSAPSGKTGCRLWFRRAFRVFGALFLLCLLAAGALTLYLNPDCERENGVVYGQRDGRDLTFDLVRPKRPNGLGVLLGDPAYYGRFGFQVHAGLQLPGVPLGYFMALAFHGPVPEGIAQYSDAFNAAA